MTPDRADRHGELPLDPDSATPARPLHRQPAAWLWVFAGGILGTGMRWYAEQFAPATPGHWPWGTFTVNLSGAFILGVLLETLARMGSDDGWRSRARLFAGTGLCGAYTTYSALALEISLLGRSGDALLGALYGVASVVAGVVTAWAGIALAARRRRTAP